MSETKLPPGPKGNVLFTSRKELRDDILGLIERHKAAFDDISRLRIGPYFYINVYKPEFIEQVFGDSNLYSKGRENANLKYLLGNGLLTNEGEFWMKQRRLIQPIFHKRRLATSCSRSSGSPINSWMTGRHAATGSWICMQR